ncbi:MAG: hypothetical protein GY859_06260, partial [Desulfobacterales bacterium]|nr:hypothetical protein [Desulfobacterales bacterium]
MINTYVELGRITWAKQVLDRFLHLYPEKTGAWKLAVWAALQRFDHATAAGPWRSPPASIHPTAISLKSGSACIGLRTSEDRRAVASEGGL